MADLHEALKALAPVDWSDVPQGDDLKAYITDAVTAGELICNSVPPLPRGTPFSDSRPHYSTPNAAASHTDIHPSAARAQPPHPEHEALQRIWGKPMKVHDKDNPLRVSVFKTAGKDRHGSWFARRSVHEGIGFEMFKRAMEREFATSASVEGGPGAGAIRGLAADRKLEDKVIEGVGRLEVWHLSAQFPGPVTARDFVALALTSDAALTEKSAAEFASGRRHVPRHYMIVSKPVHHPDAPERAGYVRAQYESVEMIREIPLSTKPVSQSTPNLLLGKSFGSDDGAADDKHKSTRDRGHTVSTTTLASDQVTSGKNNDDDDEGLSHDPELNPVEWIMVTRSDPGGGIPRFLVDRGTPETMLGDLNKFFNWACKQAQLGDADANTSEDDVAAAARVAALADGKNASVTSLPVGKDSSTTGVAGTSHENETARKRASTTPLTSTTLPQSQAPGSGGIISSLTQAIGTGIDNYAPAAVSGMLHRQLGSPSPPTPSSTEDDDDTSSVSSGVSFLSASEHRPEGTTLNYEVDPRSSDSLAGDRSFTPDLSTPGSTVTLDKDGKPQRPQPSRKLTQHEKDLVKLAHKREKLEQELAKKRASEEAKLRSAEEKSHAEAAKQQEKIEKELAKMEEKHKKEMAKLEAKREKEARKIEEKRQKRKERDEGSAVARERDEFRSQVALWRREAEILRERLVELEVRERVLEQRVRTSAGEEQEKIMEEIKDEVAKEVAAVKKQQKAALEGNEKTTSRDSLAQGSVESVGSSGSISVEAIAAGEKVG